MDYRIVSAFPAANEAARYRDTRPVDVVCWAVIELLTDNEPDFEGDRLVVGMIRIVGGDRLDLVGRYARYHDGSGFLGYTGPVEEAARPRQFSLFAKT